MIDSQNLNTPHNNFFLFRDSQNNWIIPGSLGMALQSINIEINDLDYQPNQQGIYQIESHFSEIFIKAVHYSVSEQIGSYYGDLEINGVKVEMRRDIQKLIDNQVCDEPD